jgi:hypothetical protein
MSQKKVVLLPVHPPKLNLLSKTLWSLSHVKGLYVYILCHKCSESQVTFLDRYRTAFEDLKITNDSTDSNLSVRLNQAKVGFEPSTVFYRLDAGDVVHLDKFQLSAKDNILVTHDALIKYPDKFTIVKYKGFLSQLIRNRLVHSSFIFADSDYDEEVVLAQDYVMSLSKITNKKHHHIHKIMVTKDMTIAGNTVNKRALSIKGSIYGKKMSLGRILYYPFVLIDYVKLCFLRFKA